MNSAISRRGVSANHEQFGPWAIVTGASSGIGRGFARSLAAQGLNLVLTSRRKRELDALNHELSAKHGVSCRVLEVDLSVPDAALLLNDETRDLDVGLLISNAGAGQPGGFLTTSREQLLAHLRLNALAHFDLARSFGTRFVQRGRGGMLFVGALGAAEGIPFMANDGASKAYVQSLAEALNLEFKRLGQAVNVTALVVGPTATPVIEQFFGPEAKLPMKPLSVEQTVREALSAQIALWSSQASLYGWYERYCQRPCSAA